jgi:hypothetical protein
MRGTVLSAAIGGIAILFSHPAVLVALVLVAALITQRWGSRGRLAVLAFGLGAGALVVVITSLILSPAETQEFMRDGWHDRGFMPWGPEALIWLPHRIAALEGLFIGHFQVDTLEESVVAWIFTVLAAIGLWSLARRDARGAFLLSAPLVAAVFASAARILPLSRRVALYLGPVLLIMALAGTDQIRAWLPRRGRMVRTGISAALVAVPALTLLLFLQFPDRREEARQVLKELKSRWREGDEMFALPGGRLAMVFYGERVGLPESRMGTGNLRAQLRQVDSLRGNPRVWLFYTHSVPCAQEIVRSYLGTIGREIDRIEDPYGNRGKSEAAAYLYDLSDPERLGIVNSGTYRLPGFVAENCGYPQDGPWDTAKSRLRRWGSVLRQDDS